MRRRGIGVGAIKKKRKEKVSYQEVGKEIEEEQIEHVQETIEKFRGTLEVFNPIFSNISTPSNHLSTFL